MSNVHGATTKKPNTMHVAAASHARAPMSFRLTRIEWTRGDQPEPWLKQFVRVCATELNSERSATRSEVAVRPHNAERVQRSRGSMCLFQAMCEAARAS